MDGWIGGSLDKQIPDSFSLKQAHLTCCNRYLARPLSGHHALQRCNKSLWLDFCIQTPLYNLHAMLTVTHYA